jgi:hypothetical protein
MELKPHFRVVRFSPVPEVQEPVNVALLFVEDKARLVSDFEFEKLGCVAPSFDKSILRFWLEDIRETLSSVQPEDAYTHLASRTAQIQVGPMHWLTRKLSPEFELRLINNYLRRGHRHNAPSERHLQYVDSLIEDEISKVFVKTGRLLKRARPETFLSPQSLNLLSAKNIRFSRVLNGTKQIVLMDGLNLAVTSRAQIKQRAAEVGYGYYTLGISKNQIEQIEQKSIVRAAFLFHRPIGSDPEIDYAANLMSRDADLLVEPESGKNVAEVQKILQTSSESLID